MHACFCVWTHECVCIHLCVALLVCVNVSLSVCVFVCLPVCVNLSVCRPVCLCVSVCVCVCLLVYLSVYVYNPVCCVSVHVPAWPSNLRGDGDRAVWALTDTGCLHRPIVCHSLIMFIDLEQKFNLMEWGGGGVRERRRRRSVFV